MVAAVLMYGSVESAVAQTITSKLPFLHPIEQTDAGYTGPGVEWVLSKGIESRFLLFGEQHGVEGIAQFVASVYDRLNGEGYHHLALEVDRWTTSRIEQVGMSAFIQKYPHSLAFDTNGDLELIATALRNDTTKNAQTLWGLDQMITAIHPFQRLETIAPNMSAARLARGASLKASLKMGEYLRQEHYRDLERLQEAFAPQTGSEAALILEDLQTSMKIYVAWRAGQRGEISRQISPELRESMMKERLDTYLASMSDQSASKVVFKMGGAHTMYGVGPNGIETLGEHARQVAAKNGHKTLSVSLRAFREDLAFPDSSHFGDAAMLLLDTKGYAQQAQEDSLPPLGQYDAQFDAIIYLANATRASSSIVRQEENKFRSALITTLATGMGPGLLLLTVLIPLFVKLLRRRDDNVLNPAKPFYLLFLFSLLALAVTAFQIHSIRTYPQFSAAIGGFPDPWLFVLYVVAGLFLLLNAFAAWRKNHWSLFSRIYCTVMTLCFLWFSAFLYYWHLGTMF